MLKKTELLSLNLEEKNMMMLLNVNLKGKDLTLLMLNILVSKQMKA